MCVAGCRPSQARRDLVACGQTGSSGIIFGHFVPAAPMPLLCSPCMSACLLSSLLLAPHASAAEKEMVTDPSSHDGRRFVRLLGYVLAEFHPATRQRSDLCSPHRDAHNNNINITSGGSCSAAVVIDAETIARLRGECSCRGVPLESALLASLYLAAARAVGEEDKVPRGASEGKGHDHGNIISRRTNDVVRLQRALVLGVVSVVMALLSGSVDSKVLRYFCSFYALFAGKSSSAGSAACLRLLGQLLYCMQNYAVHTRWHTDCPHCFS